MCEVGKLLEIIDVEPLNLPAPLHNEGQPEQEPMAVPVEDPATETTPVNKL